MQGAEVVVAGGTLRLAGPLGPDMHAYVDSDWVRDERAATVRALVAGGKDPDAAAASAFAAAALDVAQFVPEGVEVVGGGVVAELVRRFTRTSEAPRDPPDAVVDTVGTAVSVAAALARVADLGLVVVAAPVHEPLRISLYPDLHVRGLELVCVDPTLPRDREADVDVTEVLTSLSVARDGRPLDPGARWFRVDG